MSDSSMFSMFIFTPWHTKLKASSPPAEARKAGAEKWRRIFYFYHWRPILSRIDLSFLGSEVYTIFDQNKWKNMGLPQISPLSPQFFPIKSNFVTFD